MVEFTELNARLTEATKNRLGELVTFTPRTGSPRPNIRAIVDRDVEIVGSNGQISDLRNAASLPIVDIGLEVEGARVKTAAGEDFYVDAKLGDDGQYIRVALR